MTAAVQSEPTCGKPRSDEMWAAIRRALDVQIIRAFVMWKGGKTLPANVQTVFSCNDHCNPDPQIVRFAYINVGIGKYR